MAVYDVTGSFDATLVCRFKNSTELNKFVKGLVLRKDVEATETHIVLNTVKEDFRLKL